MVVFPLQKIALHHDFLDRSVLLFDQQASQELSHDNQFLSQVANEALTKNVASYEPVE